MLACPFGLRKMGCYMKKIWKKGISWILAGSMLFGVIGPVGRMDGTEKNTVEAAQKLATLTIDGNTLDTGENSSFRGLGAVSCSNSSRLLMDYKEEHRDEYWEIMKWLFHTKTGAGLSHIKIELGNDLDSSSGAEPATKRSAGQKANVRRGAGFMFAHDALTINPDISVDLICRGMPAWVEQAYEKSGQAGYQARYRWYKETIDAAYDKWDITFSYISANRNEKMVEKEWTKYLRKSLNTEKIQRYDYSKIKIVAADEAGAAQEMLKDSEYRNAVDVIGCHDNAYADETVRKLHSVYKKEIWLSEGASIATDSIFGANNTVDGRNTSGRKGMLDIANRIITCMSQSDMTMYEFQPAVISNYDAPDASLGRLIKADTPWSGGYSISNGLVMAMHFTNFIKKGWRFVDSGCYGGQAGQSAEGIKNNYLTAAKKSTGDYSTVLINDSDTAKTYEVAVSNVKKASSKVIVWETKSNDTDEQYDAHWLEKIGTLHPTKIGNAYVYEVTVKPYTMMTLTTTTGQTEYAKRKAKAGMGLQKEAGLSLPYTDDFEYKSAYLKRRGRTPRYTCDVNGAFEVVSQGNSNHVLCQQINKDHLGTGSDGAPVKPLTSFGDDRWKDYILSADVMLDSSENEKNYAAIIARYNASHSAVENGYQLRIYRGGSWALYSNQGKIAKGTVSGMREGRLVNLKLKVLGNKVSAYINNELAVRKTIKESPVNSGRAALASAYYKNYFDNVKVIPVQNGATHVERVDDLDSALQFSSSVSRLQSQSSRYYNGTVSVLAEKSESFSYTFTGTGISILGNNLAGAKIKVTLDGKEIDSRYAVKATEHRSAFYQLSGLEMGEHIIRVELVNEDILRIDAVEVEKEAYTAEAGRADRILLENETLELAYGESVSFGARLEPENANERIIYTTSNMAVAMVASDGRVIGNGAGEAVITASIGNGEKVSAKVIVTQLAITPRSGIRLGAGERIKLKASYVKGINKAPIKKWKSSNKKLAVVSSKGMVRAKRAGDVTITVVGNNGYKGKAVIHIRKAPYRIKAMPQSISLKAGGAKKLRCKVPSGCFATKIVYKSSSPEIAKVSKTGVIRARKAGTCRITAETYNGKTAVVAVRVTD